MLVFSCILLGAQTRSRVLGDCQSRTQAVLGIFLRLPIYSARAFHDFSPLFRDREKILRREHRYNPAPVSLIFLTSVSVSAILSIFRSWSSHVSSCGTIVCPSIGMNFFSRHYRRESRCRRAAAGEVDFGSVFMAYFNLFNFQALLIVFAVVLVSGGYSMHLFERQYLVRQGTASGTFSAAGTLFAPDALLLSTTSSRSGNANGGPVYMSTNVSGVPKTYLVATGTDHTGMNISGYPSLLFERSAFSSFTSSLWFSLFTSCVGRVSLLF
jgi:hypothetical protein